MLTFLPKPPLLWQRFASLCVFPSLLEWKSGFSTLDVHAILPPLSISALPLNLPGPHPSPALNTQLKIEHIYLYRCAPCMCWCGSHPATEAPERSTNSLVSAWARGQKSADVIVSELASFVAEEVEKSRGQMSRGWSQSTSTHGKIGCGESGFYRTFAFDLCERLVLIKISYLNGYYL